MCNLRYYRETSVIRHLYNPTFSLIPPSYEVQSPYIFIHAKTHSIIRQCPNLTPLSGPIECWIREISLHIACNYKTPYQATLNCHMHDFVSFRNNDVLYLYPPFPSTYSKIFGVTQERFDTNDLKLHQDIHTVMLACVFML